MFRTENVLPRASASRRHSSSTAMADESNRSSAPASATAALPDSERKPCASMRTQAGAWSCVSSAGRISTGSALFLDVAGRLAVALDQRRDQAVHALGADLLRELAAIGFNQP